MCRFQGWNALQLMGASSCMLGATAGAVPQCRVGVRKLLAALHINPLRIPTSANVSQSPASSPCLDDRCRLWLADTRASSCATADSALPHRGSLLLRDCGQCSFEEEAEPFHRSARAVARAAQKSGKQLRASNHFCPRSVAQWPSVWLCCSWFHLPVAHSGCWDRPGWSAPSARRSCPRYVS